ncbi:MAG: c-type cytochrome [Betaproteobacteria bacterium]|nr:c-type cytochrome [Betaproteobacteria bacterium]MDH3436892.1 c-type cytochrome [Betaproteobacteria bacterium]
MSRTAQVRYPTVLFLAVAAALIWCAGAAAQGGTTPTGEAVDLRAVFANAADIAEGRRVAQTCARCHGENGIGTTKDVPHVAGQRPAYLFNKLRAYQTGARRDPIMEPAVKFLSDDALVKVAAYYSSLEPAQPLASALKAPSAQRDPVAAGKATAAACGGCHGDDGVSKIPGMPSLAGLDPKYFVVAMKGYVNGQRKNDMMKSFATPLTDADLNNLALYYGLQKPKRAETPAAGDQAAGKKAAANCAGCHGEQGVSTNSANPSLAGQDAEYLVAALRAYKDGSRTEGTMKNAVAALGAGTLKDLAAFYAAQQPQAPKVVKPLSTAEWVQRCDRCHGVNGNSTDPRAPAMAAQRADYLAKVLHAYQNGARKESVMAAMTSSLTKADIASLAAYYARQRARAFVYVTLPCK